MRNEFVKKLWYNRTTCTDSDYSPEDFSRLEVGKNDVTKIVECPAQGEGDKWSYEIFINGKLERRIFHPSHCEYFVGEELEQKKREAQEF